MRHARSASHFAAALLLLLLAVCARAAGEPPASADVVVVGGGSGGFAAALQAARMGASVVLLEQGSMLGGMYTSAGVACFDGNPYLGHTEALTTGIFGEIVARIRAHYGHPEQSQPVCFEPAVARSILEQMAAERSNLMIVYRARVVSAVMNGSRVEGLVYLDESQQPHEVSAAVVIDATEYGDIADMAGAQYRLGRESWGETGEDTALGGPFNVEVPWNPGASGDGLAQATTQVAVLRNMRAPAPIVPTPAQYDRNRLYDFDNPMGYWTSSGTFKWGYGLREFLQYSAVTPPGTSASALDPNNPATWPDLFFINWPLFGNDYMPATPLAALDEQGRVAEQQTAKNLALGLVRVLQQHLRLALGYNPLAIAADQYGTADGLPPSLYVREGRRALGLYTLSEHDIARLDYKPGQAPGSGISQSCVALRGTHMWDGIAVGDYFMDAHPCKPLPGFYTPSLALIRYRGSASGGLGRSTAPFQVPYRCLVPASVDGLLLGDKAISVTHNANSATRLQPVVTLIGQAAGAAAALAAAQQIQPRQVNVRELQQALLDSGDALYYFSDIYPNHWAFKEIQSMAVAGVMCARYPDPVFPRVNLDYDDWRDHAFYPDRQVTRAQVAVYLARAKGLGDCAASGQYFGDVPSNAWEYNAVDCLRRQGIIAGCSISPPMFCPTGAVNRAQMAVFIWRAKGLSPYNNPVPTFVDVPPANPSYGMIEAAYAAGLLNRIAAPPYYYPSRYVNRAELAVFLCNAFWPSLSVNQAPELILSRYASGQRFVLYAAPGRTLDAWFRAFDPDGDGVTVSVQPMPQGASFDPGMAHFSWTPGPESIGSHSITVFASDGRATCSQPFSIVVGPKISIGPQSGSSATATRTVTLSVNAPGATLMRFSYPGVSGWTPWEPAAATKQITVSAGDGGKTIYAQASDAQGHTSAAASLALTLDTAPPAQAALIIQEGLAQTRDQTLRLHIKAVDWTTWPQEMRFKYPGQDWTAWEPFAPYKYVPRPIASGSCTIWLQCRDAVANESAAVSDSINLLP
jgi:hypothetical protein